MVTSKIAVAGAGRYVPRWGQTWLLAVGGPSRQRYRSLLERHVGLRTSAVWVLGASFVAGLLNTGGSLLLEPAARQYLDWGLLVTLPTWAMLQMVAWLLFVCGAYLIGRVLKGKGALATVAFVSAALTAPLTVGASLVDLVPGSDLVLLALYGYWLGVSVVGVSVAHQFARLKGLLAVVVSVCLLGVLAAVMLVGAGLLTRWLV